MGKKARRAARELTPVVRSGTANPSEWLINWVRGGEPTSSGATVSPETAMQVSTVFACVRVLAEDVAKLPLLVYRRRPDGGRERAVDHPLYRMLSRSPNPMQTSFEFREMLQGHLELRGNAYAEVLRDGRARPTALMPRHPLRVTVMETADEELFYQVKDAHGGTRRVPAADMLHFKGLSSDGKVGLSPIALQREAIGMAIAAGKYGGTFFANDAQPRGILYHPNTLSDAATANVQDTWQRERSGKKRHSIAVLEEGMKYQQVGMSNEDAQFLQTRQHQREEIAAIWRIPQHKIGILTRSTFSNIEQQALEYVGDSLLPRLRRAEQTLERVLLSEAEQDEYYIEFLVEGLLRADQSARYAAYAVGRQWGWLSANEIRERENMNPIEGGDTYLVPLNQVDANELPKPGDVPVPPAEPPADQ